MACEAAAAASLAVCSGLNEVTLLLNIIWFFFV